MSKMWLILPYLKVTLYHPSVLAHLDKYCSPIVFVASFQFVKLKEHSLRFATEIPNITSLKSLLSSFRPQPRFFQILWRTLDLCQVNRLWESNTQLISFLITSFPVSNNILVRSPKLKVFCLSWSLLHHLPKSYNTLLPYPVRFFSKQPRLLRQTMNNHFGASIQLPFTRSMLTIETLEKGVKHVQSW